MRLLLAAPLTRAIAVALVCVPAIVAQERPLPDKDQFLREARQHLRSDSSVQSSYIYTETRREQKLDDNGRVQEESVKVYENYPALPGERRWTQLISEDGRARPASELEKENRDRQRRAELLARDTTSVRQRDDADKRREFEAIVDDLFLVYDIRLERRESLNGHDTLVFALKPRPEAQPRTKEGSQMKTFAVRAWLSESEKELVRVDAEALDNMSMGFGLFARLHKGAKMSYLRTKVNNEVWLPARSSYSGSARVGLLVVLRRAGSSEYSGYRKFTVGTSATYQAVTPNP